MFWERHSYYLGEKWGGLELRCQQWEWLWGKRYEKYLGGSHRPGVSNTECVRMTEERETLPVFSVEELGGYLDRVSRRKDVCRRWAGKCMLGLLSLRYLSDTWKGKQGKQMNRCAQQNGLRYGNGFRSWSHKFGWSHLEQIVQGGKEHKADKPRELRVKQQVEKELFNDQQQRGGGKVENNNAIEV